MKPMLYKNWIKARTRCPFCGRGNQILKARRSAYLTYALAPYAPYHLLVIPTRHVVSFLKLTKSEEKDIGELLKLGASLLTKLNVKDFSVLVRDGGNRAKSVPHLHYHIIPKHRIGDLDKDGRDRSVLTKRQIDNLMRRLKKLAPR